MVVLGQLRTRDVAAQLDVAEEAKARMRSGLLVDARDRLDLRMVGRDAGAHQPPGRGQPLDHVDLEIDGVPADPVLEQVPSGVEAGGPGADDCDADGVMEMF